MGTSERIGMNHARVMAAIAAAAAGIVFAVIFAGEPWQRPLRFLQTGETVWLAAAVAAFTLAALLWPMGDVRRWMWRLVVWAALCAFVLPVSRHARSDGLKFTL